VIKSAKSPILLDPADQIEILNPQHELSYTKFYYYKRFFIFEIEIKCNFSWIWMNFSWLCSSLCHNFSEMIEKCFESPTKYLNIDQEQEFTLDALRVVLQADLQLEKLYPKQKPIFNRPRNPLALQPDKIERNMKKILEEKSPERFFDEKEYIYEKGGNFKVGVVKIKGKMPNIRKFSPQNVDRNQENPIDFQKNRNFAHSLRSFPSKARSLSPQIMNESFETKEERKFFITQEFLNFSRSNMDFEKEIQGNNNTTVKTIKTGFFFPNIGRNEAECSKILNKSRNEKDKLKQFSSNKNFDKKNQNVLPRLTEEFGKHTKKEIELLEHQQKNLVEEYNKYYNKKYVFLLIFNKFLIFFSKKLARVLKGMKIMEFSYENSEKIFTHKDDLLKILMGLEVRITESEKKDKEKSLEKHRLLKILKICQMNLIQNKEYTDVFINENYQKKLIKL